MKQFFILFLTLRLFGHSRAIEEFCPAVDLVCKNQVIEKNTGKVIRRWLDKIRISPLCFIGEQSETIHHEADNTYEVVRLSHGVRDGVGITFLDEAQKYASRVTLYRNGERVGPTWDLTLGRGYNSSYHFKSRSRHVEEAEELSPLSMFGGGALYDSTVWLYPDMETLMVGQWSGGLMQRGQVGEVVSLTCHKGVMMLTTRTLPGAKIYKYDPPSATRIATNPLDMDPYETKNIECKKSRIQGQGLFAKRWLKKGSVVSYFNGYRVSVDYVKKSMIESMGGEEDFEHMSEDDPRFQAYLERKSYIIALDPSHDIDIEPGIANNLDKYRATLGHKVNHWVKPNSYFAWALHPLFGRVRSLVALRDVKVGEEVTVDYDYDPDDKFTPKWFKKMYKYLHSDG